MSNPDTKLPNNKRQVWIFVAVGLTFVVLAIAFGRYSRLADRFNVDYGGQVVDGELDVQENGKIRLRFSGPDGAIYRSTYTPMPGYLEQYYEAGPVEVRYMPDDPRRCQPAGASFRTGTITLILFCFGFACVLRARRIATQAARAS